MHYLGAHTKDTGGLHMAAARAGSAGMQALQIFTAIPKFYGDRSSIRPERVTRFRDTLQRANIAPSRVVAHAAYVLNTATPDDAKWTRAAAGLAKELERSTALGIGMACFHPGAATDGDRNAATARVARAITQALEAVDGETKLVIENTAGAGLTIGRTPEEIGAILAAIPTHLRHRTGYGLDTCHLFAAGHDITSSQAAFTDVLDAFAKAATEPPAFFHLNDSEFPFASNRDRHALIGQGKIGVEPYRWLLQDHRSQNIPLILETPQATEEPADTDETPDPLDVEMLHLLQSLRPIP